MASRGKEQRRKGDGANHGYRMALVLALLALLSAPAQSTASELKDQTLAAWDGYISSACVRAEIRAKESPFLRISELPETRRRVQAGEISVWREGEDHPARVPHGLIHDWMGAVFIPKATIAEILAVTRDYDRYPEIYKPAVIEAEELGSAGNDDRFSMVLIQKVLFVTAAMQGEYETRYVQVDAKRCVWRLYTFTKFEESDGGVYIELEALGLSRDVPSLLRWLVDPIVEHLPRNSLHATLEETRDAVLARISRED